MPSITKHGPRIAITLLPLLLALLHAVGVLHLEVLQRLDDILYDARLSVTAPKTLDERIVIIDIDEKSLAEVGRWPWGRNQLASLVDGLFERQQIALLGMDVVFAEPDTSSGLAQLNALAHNELKDQPGFAQRLRDLQSKLNYDERLAQALKGRPVVLGYYFSSEDQARVSGVLPNAVLDSASLQGRQIRTTAWNGYGSNLEVLARAAPAAGFFNAITDSDGVVRSLPLLAQYQGRYYESLPLAMFRVMAGMPALLPGFSNEKFLPGRLQAMDRVVLQLGDKSLSIPVDERAATLIPFRGRGGPAGGSYQYVSATDVLQGKLAPGSLAGKIALLGTSAPGLLDLRVTPLSETYPGVETHANLISGLLDGNTLLRPDFALGYEVASLLLAGLVLALGLPQLSALQAVGLNGAVVLALVASNFWLYTSHGLVLPLASALAMAVSAFALNMSYGYFVESRTKRELAGLFGTYVPPELVDEMVKDPQAYTMRAHNRELTVMFCDMRGFTQMSEKMEPVALQALLNGVFSKLTSLIRAQQGTIDKYMGDCVMAFWGAPVATPGHASLAVQAALHMVQAVHGINQEHQQRGLPAIGIGVGLNTGSMCVGDMGSDIRRSYTVIGDAVNLGSRLEGLCKVYGVDIVASESTRLLAPDCAWQELDRVCVKGKAEAVAIFCPLPADLAEPLAEELAIWAAFLKAYRSQGWEQAKQLLETLMQRDPQKYLYQLYAERVASMQLLPPDPAWDGATHFETK